MGLGSRFLNLFSPTKGSPNSTTDNNNNNDDEDGDNPLDGEQIQFSDNDVNDNDDIDNDGDDAPLNSTTATATVSTAAAAVAAKDNNNKSATTNNASGKTPSKSTMASTTTSSASSKKKKGHCNYPGCTRALFARGQCYRHDTEMKNSNDGAAGIVGGDSSNGGDSGKSCTPRGGSSDVVGSSGNGVGSSGSDSNVGGVVDGGGSQGSPNEEGKKQQSSSGGNDNKKNKSTTKQSKAKSNETTTPSPLSSSAKKTSSTTTSSSSSRKKSSSGSLKHCNHPGCTRALFARGKCYRHDTEAQQQQQRSNEDDKKIMSPPPAAAKSNNNNLNSPSSSLLVGKKKKKKRKSNESETTTTKKKSSSSGSLKHCSHPGCTRALFARGMCYRHDTEAKRRIIESGGGGGIGSNDGVCPVARKRTPSPPKAATTTTKPTTKTKREKKVVAAAAPTDDDQPASNGKRKKKGHCNYPGCTRALFARGKCYRHDHETRGISGGGGGGGTNKQRSSSNGVKKSNRITGTGGPRKSAIARRPRQLKPTQKLLEMQEDALVLYDAGGGKKKASKKRKNDKVSTFSNPPKKKMRGGGGSVGGVSMEELTANTTTTTCDEEEIEESNYDNVVCCLCKCGVDFSDADFFLPEDSCDGQQQQQQQQVDGVKEVKGHSSLEEEDNTLDESNNGGGGEVKLGNLKSEGLEDDDYAGKEMNGEAKDNLKRERLEDDDCPEKETNGVAKDNLKREYDDTTVDYPEKETNGEAKDNLKREYDDTTVDFRNEGTNNGAKSSEDDDTADNDDDEEKPIFQLPRRFYNPRNGLILCDGPAYAGKRRRGGGSSSNGQQPQQQLYQCERAYHQRCHFIPVFAVPRGPWRCLICRYRDQEYLKQKKGKGGNNAMNDDSDARIFTDQELNVMFRCNIPQPKDDDTAMVGEEEEEKAVITNVPPALMSPSKSDIASLEHEFENVTGPLKAKIMKEDLTTKAEKVINAALSNIRNSEHSLRSFTETSRSRKALAERIQNIGGLPQELTQCVMRIAQNKLRIKDLIVVLEESIRCAPHHVNTKSEDATGCIDAVSELMQWYLSQSSPEEAAHFNPDETQDSKTFLQHLFPEGGLHRRRFEPRTGEARVEAEEDASVKSDSSGVSLDDLKCSCCHGGAATDDNDMLLCDGIGCYRAFHMQCLEPKVTLEEVEAAGEDEAWFCPLCTAHANLVHYAQREYLLDDWEHDWDEIMRRRGHSEWETAEDVFPEAEVELRVAQKFKDGIKDDETTLFIAETFGIGGAAAGIESDTVDDEDALAVQDDEDEEDDEDFDIDGPVEEDSDGNSSADEDLREEKKLLKEKIGRDELDALSICSSSEESDSDASSDEDEKVRRSKRRRFTFPPPPAAAAAAAAKDGDLSGNDQSNDSKSKDMGALDTSNIVRGKRSRSKVDYRKLADTMFGDDSDEEAKGSVMKYDYKPKIAPVNESSDEGESSSSDDEELDSDDEDDPKSRSGEK